LGAFTPAPGGKQGSEDIDWEAPAMPGNTIEKDESHDYSDTDFSRQAWQGR
jgi:hypothetical protein